MTAVSLCRRERSLSRVGIRRLIPLLLFVLCSALQAQNALLTRISSLEESGKFKQAATLISSEMTKATDAEAKKTLEFELDRLRRITLDYPYSRDKVWQQVQRRVKDATRDEFERWIAEGKFDIRNIDGEERFVNTSTSNLFWRYPQIRARKAGGAGDSVFDRLVWENVRSITVATQREGKSYVLPKRFRVDMNLSVGAGTVPAGSIIRAWLPIPRAFPFQTDFSVISSSSPVQLDEPSSPIRSAYFEQPASDDSMTIFRIVYEYQHMGIRFPLDPAKVQPLKPGEPFVRQYTAEAPHVEFTDSMRALAASIAGGISNPILKARAYYEWMAQNIQYSYAIEYSTIRNIGEYCRAHRYGDCGQEALLFITLCRMSGIPARWQSGWFTFPHGFTMHDWTEIYVRPYGWIPVDPYMGIFAMQYLETLPPDARREVRDFYFGGLDQYRIAANSDHSQELRPAKKGLRSETVDFQRGEVEANGTNIYFDKFSYHVDVKELPPSP